MGCNAIFAPTHSLASAAAADICRSKMVPTGTSSPVLLPVRQQLRLRRRRLQVVASIAVGPSSDQSQALERCLAISSSAPKAAPTMKSGYGAFGAVTLEKSKLDLTQKTTRTSPEIATGGGGGDIGKRNSHGGGDGGDDGGDDDDYFADFDEGDDGDDGGLFRRRLVLQELFDRKFVDSVLQEWYKTMMELPAGLRQAYEMGLVSSAQMVRFLSTFGRPTTCRAISRGLPQSLSRAFIGSSSNGQELAEKTQLNGGYSVTSFLLVIYFLHLGLFQISIPAKQAFDGMIADPSFLYKLLLEQFATISSSVWWEVTNRKDRIKQEWNLALINVMTLSACNVFVVWSLAPCRSYGDTFRFDLQNTIQKLPNNIFEKSYIMREFDLQKRVHSFFYKAAEFCLVGMIGGSIQGALSKSISSKKEGRLAVTIPSVPTSALGYGAFLGLYANLRYQLLCGMDQAFFYHFDVPGVAIFLSTAMRILNVQIGEKSRLAWLGIEVDPLLQSDNLLKAYNRPSEAAADQFSSNWFISKNAVISRLGLLGIKQGSGDSEAPAKARRKRVVRRKVSSTSA